MHGESQLQQEEKEEEVEEERMVKEEAAKEDSQEEVEEQRKKRRNCCRRNKRNWCSLMCACLAVLSMNFVDHIEDRKMNYKDHNRVEQELSDNFHKSALDKQGNTQKRKFKQFRKRATVQTQNPKEKIKETKKTMKTAYNATAASRMIKWTTKERKPYGRCQFLTK